MFPDYQEFEVQLLYGGTAVLYVTAGFKGNARVILPGLTACIDCTLDLYPPQVRLALILHVCSHSHFIPLSLSLHRFLSI